MNSLIENKALTRDIADMLQMCVSARLNVLISGGTGAGKTTLLNALSAYIPEDERIVTIEDVAELMLQQRHVVRQQRTDQPERLFAKAADHGGQRRLRGGVAGRALEPAVDIEADVARAWVADVGAQQGPLLRQQLEAHRGESAQ